MSKRTTHRGQDGGITKGKSHEEGGIKAIVVDTGQPVELEGGEVIINKKSSKMFAKELSEINQAGGGVPIPTPDEYRNGGEVVEFNRNDKPHTFAMKYARKIKKDMPEIWNKYGKSFENNLFEVLDKVFERGYWKASEKDHYKVWKMYCFNHKHKNTPEHIVGMFKCGAVTDQGYGAMKKVVERLHKGAPEPKKARKGAKIKSGAGWKHKSKKKDDKWIQGAEAEMEKKGTVGAFTKQAKREGYTPVEFAEIVLNNPEEFSETTRKRAQFVANTNPEKFRKGGKADRPSPSVSATSVEEGTVLEGNDGNLYISEKRGKAKSQRWYKFSGEQKKSEVSEQEIYEALSDTINSDLPITIVAHSGKNRQARFKIGGNELVKDGKLVIYSGRADGEKKYTLKAPFINLTKHPNTGIWSLRVSEFEIEDGGSAMSAFSKWLEAIGIFIQELANVDEETALRWYQETYSPDEYMSLFNEGKFEKDVAEEIIKDHEKDHTQEIDEEPKREKRDFELDTPTGEPTHLPYLQQILVRTSSFKRWFGDWETAAKGFIADGRENYSKHFKGVSRAINPVTLEPMLYWHGTRSSEEFYEFRVRTKDYQKGRPYIYFAENPEYAYTFTMFNKGGDENSQGLMYGCFINCKNPLTLTDSLALKQLTPIEWLSRVTYAVLFDKYGIVETNETAAEVASEIVEKLSDYANQVLDEDEKKIDFWRLMAHDSDSLFKDYLESQGYDGVYFSEQMVKDFDRDNLAHWTKAFAVFSSKQVKLADGRNLDFDPTNPDIRFEHGGTTEKKLSKKDEIAQTIFGEKFEEGGQVNDRKMVETRPPQRISRNRQAVDDIIRKMEL